jgi:hypothetical protein
VVVARLSPVELTRFVAVPAADRSRVRIVLVPRLTPGVDAMTLGRYVFVKRGHERDRGLIAHELVHVRQWREHGVVGFLARYLGSYVVGRSRGLDHSDAYASIPFEIEARTLTGA